MQSHFSATRTSHTDDLLLFSDRAAGVNMCGELHWIYHRKGPILDCYRISVLLR